MAFDRHIEVGKRDALAVISNPDQAFPALFDVDDDPSGLGI